MRHWSLRGKLTAWSALIVGVVLVVCCTGAAIYLQGEQLEALDDQLKNEAATFFGAVGQINPPINWKKSVHVEAILPRASTPRFVEIVGADGATLYRSRELDSGSLPRLAAGAHTIKVGQVNARLYVFTSGGLTLYLAVALSEISADQKNVVMVGLVGLPLLIGLTALGGWWLSRKALEPVREIAVAAEQITADRLDRRLPMPRVHDEIGRLTEVLNAMFDRLDTSFRQAARFSADASHELKTPLTVLRAGIEDLLKSHELAPGDQAAVSALLEQVRRLTNIIESLLLLSRADAGHLQLDFAPADVAEIVTGCTDDARIMAEDRKIEIGVEGDEALIANVDARRLAQIILNLLENAVKYNREGGRIRVRTADTATALTITVANTGPGIAAQYMPQLFERFFRAGQHGDVAGQGLGLSLSRELARAHGGDVVLVKSDEEWTVFELRLPLEIKSTPATAPAPLVNPVGV